MKSIVNTPKDKFKEIKYPHLLIGKDDDEIVLFVESRIGTVVSDGGPHKIGFYCESWAMDEFEFFNGTVELSND